MKEIMQIDQFPHHTPIKVSWGEMDALGHVNNIIYFRYLETARIHFFESLDLPLPTTHSGLGPILAHIECQFLSAIQYPDDLIVGSHIHHFGTTSLKMRHAVHSSRQDRIVAHGDSVIVMVNYQTMEKAAIPEAFKQRVADYQSAADPDFTGA